jgi:hypothetical protein
MEQKRQPYQLIPQCKPHYVEMPPNGPEAPVHEPLMKEWERRMKREHGEAKVVIDHILDSWIALLFKGRPIPRPKTKWQRRTQEGFQLFVAGLRESGIVF